MFQLRTCRRDSWRFGQGLGMEFLLLFFFSCLLLWFLCVYVCVKVRVCDARRVLFCSLVNRSEG